MAPLITLLSDFGLTDAYVGIMKGAIMAIAPGTSIIDLTHDIPPQNLWAARFNLTNAIPYFPHGTIHVAVVDPGVGGDRRAVAIQLPDCTLVGPDNGIFSGILTPYLNQSATSALGQEPAITAIALTHSRYWRTSDPSTTFHGRDIFAPVAAHLAQGIPIADMGEKIEPSTLKLLELPEVKRQGKTLVGCVQYGDRFGNLITTIDGQRVEGGDWWVDIDDAHQLQGQTTYGEVEVGQPVALVGSHGWVEIAINGGSAQTYLGLDIGETVRVLLA